MRDLIAAHLHELIHTCPHWIRDGKAAGWCLAWADALMPLILQAQAAAWEAGKCAPSRGQRNNPYCAS